MPDKRYQLLRGTLPDRGSWALDTMYNSCTTQVGRSMARVIRSVQQFLKQSDAVNQTAAQCWGRSVLEVS